MLTPEPTTITYGNTPPRVPIAAPDYYYFPPPRVPA